MEFIISSTMAVVGLSNFCRKFVVQSKMFVGTSSSQQFLGLCTWKWTEIAADLKVADGLIASRAGRSELNSGSRLCESTQTHKELRLCWDVCGHKAATLVTVWTTSSQCEPRLKCVSLFLCVDVRTLHGCVCVSEAAILRSWVSRKKKWKKLSTASLASQSKRALFRSKSSFWSQRSSRNTTSNLHVTASGKLNTGASGEAADGEVERMNYRTKGSRQSWRRWSGEQTRRDAGSGVLFQMIKLWS